MSNMKNGYVPLRIKKIIHRMTQPNMRLMNYLTFNVPQGLCDIQRSSRIMFHSDVYEGYVALHH